MTPPTAVDVDRPSGTAARGGEPHRHRSGTPHADGGRHRHHVGTVGLDLHRRVLSAAGGDADGIVGALADLRDLRAAIDHAERDLLAAARRTGVSWGRVAAALGLRSRQAAEQRAARLGAQATSTDHPECQHCVDTAPVAALRAAARSAAEQMAADPSWDDTRPRAALVRAGLTAAADAPAGALYSLATHAVDDLGQVDLDGRPVLLRVAVTELRRAYRAATPRAGTGVDAG